MQRTKICLILSRDNRSWILEKIAHRLAEHVKGFGIDAVVEDHPRNDVALNHWMSYAFANEKVGTPSTLFITHVDDPYKQSFLRNLLSNYVDIGICMSKHHADELVLRGIPRESLTFVLPAHDGEISPRRIVIGIMTRLYPDGRKREKFLIKLAEEVRLDAFRFDIFGAGWEKIVPQLEYAGAEVRYYPGTSDYLSDFKEITTNIVKFDYYAYFGMDEGSLGTLDALAAGVKTIITPQGFHADLEGAITHPVITYQDVKEIFMRISEDWHSRVNSVASLTWDEYARRHAIIWKAVARGDRSSIGRLLNNEELTKNQGLATDWQYELRRLSPLRIRSALSHLPILKPLRAIIKGKRL